MAAEQGDSSSTTRLAIEELERRAEHLHQPTTRYVKSEECLRQKKDKLALEKQKELKALRAKRQALSRLKSTIAIVDCATRAYDEHIAERTLEIQLLQDHIIECRRTDIRNANTISALRELTDDIIIVDELIHGIVHSKVTEEQFLVSLEILHRKIGYQRNEDKLRNWYKNPQYRPICVILEELRSLAIVKVSKYVFDRALKFSNVLITECELPEDLDVFQKHYKFIRLNEPELIKQLLDDYVTSKRERYFGYFESLEKAVAQICESKKLIETDPTKVHRIYMGSDIDYQNEPQVLDNYFTIGSRITVFLDITEPEVVKDDTINTYFEQVFKNVHIELLDMVQKEHEFMKNCLELDHKERSDAILRMMEKTITYLSYSWKMYIALMNDPITSFLCFHLVLRFRFLIHKKGIENLDKYWDTLERALISRYSHVINLNVNSINAYDATKYVFDYRAHYVVSRYAIYTADVKRVHKLYPHPVIADLLNMLRKAINDFCVRVANLIPVKKEEMIFLINCYQEIIDAMAENFKDDCKDDVKEYLDQIRNLRSVYIDELLKYYYGNIIEYLQEVEVFAVTNNVAKIQEYAPRAKVIIEKFNVSWQKDVCSIQIYILMSFKNVTTRLGILKDTFQEIYNIVFRFSHSVSKSAKKDLVNIAAIIVLFERYQKVHQELEDMS